jgi:hypothetical protein
VSPELDSPSQVGLPGSLLDFPGHLLGQEQAPQVLLALELGGGLVEVVDFYLFLLPFCPRLLRHTTWLSLM